MAPSTATLQPCPHSISLTHHHAQRALAKMPNPRLSVTVVFASLFLGAADPEAVSNLRSRRSRQSESEPEPEPIRVVSIASDATDDTGFPPIPPFPKPTKDGIGFKRKITQVEGGATFFLGFSGGSCQTNDTYGDSSCQYQWGESIIANYTLQLGKKLDVNDVLKANLKVDHLVPYSFTCAVCGSDCVLKVPVVNNLQWSFPTPACPIDTDLIIDSFREDLGKSSPTDGIPVHVEGGVHIIRESGDIAAAFSVSVDLK